MTEDEEEKLARADRIAAEWQAKYWEVKHSRDMWQAAFLYFAIPAVFFGIWVSGIWYLVGP